MQKNFHYQTVNDTINNLKQEGFDIDFNSEHNCSAQHMEELKSQNFEVTRVCRYEGDADSLENAVIYAIESNSGAKGLLVAGQGDCSDMVHSQVLKKLYQRGILY